MAIDKFKLQAYVREKLQEEIEITSVQEQGENYLIETTGGASILYQPKEDKVSKVVIAASKVLGNVLIEELDKTSGLVPVLPLSAPTGLQTIFNTVPSQQEILPEIDFNEKLKNLQEEKDAIPLGELQPPLTFTDEELSVMRKIETSEEDSWLSLHLTTKEEFFEKAIENLLCKEHGDQFWKDYGNGSGGTCNPITLHSVKPIPGRRGPYEIYEVKYSVNSPDNTLPSDITREIKFKFEMSNVVFAKVTYQEPQKVDIKPSKNSRFKVTKVNKPVKKQIKKKK